MSDSLLSKEVLIFYVDKIKVPVRKKQVKTYNITVNGNIARSLNSCPLYQIMTWTMVILHEEINREKKQVLYKKQTLL